MKVVVVETASGLGPHLAAWQDLADHAMEKNAFYEPWLMVPALAHLPPENAMRFVFIYETQASADAAAPGAALLHAFFPFEVLPRFHGMPVSVLRLWKHLHCFLCTPLIRAEGSGEALQLLLEWASRDEGIDILDFAFVAGDGPFQRLLIENAYANGSLSHVTIAFVRALWKRRGSLEDYLVETLTPGIRKEYRRQRKRLGELGRLEFRSLSQAAEVEEWTEHFLRLESSGWKAEEGTAVAMHDGQCAYVHEAARAGFARGQVLLQGLFLDAQPLAMLFTFRSGPGSFAFKIAYDEGFAKYSPGVQVVLDFLAYAHAEPAIEWTDSCAHPKHPMINRLLQDRRVIQNVLLSTGSRTGDMAVAAYPAGKWLSRLFRRKTAKAHT